MSVLRIPVTQADHVQGPPNAPVTMVEYGDYECAFCGLAHPIVKRLKRHFGKQLRFVYRHFPLVQVHPHAQSAAETAEFAGARECFWEMHDGLFENQASLGVGLFFALAAALHLPGEELRRALDTEAYAPKVRNDFIGGVRSGVNGTPTFFVDGRRHDGSFDFEGLVSAVDAALLRANASL
jgi:protein-disulfide isomerase